MKFLGIDYGSKRVGIALSDEGGEFAFPKRVLSNTKDLAGEIKKICKDEGVQGIVIGESVSAAGEHNAIHAAAQSFAEECAAETELPIYWEKEQLTSHHSAIGVRKGAFEKGNMDASAAALILQRFLDKRSKGV